MKYYPEYQEFINESIFKNIFSKIISFFRTKYKKNWVPESLIYMQKKNILKGFGITIYPWASKPQFITKEIEQELKMWSGISESAPVNLKSKKYPNKNPSETKQEVKESSTKKE